MTRSLEIEDSVIRYRGNVIENKHSVHAAIVDSTGRLLYAVGNPSRMTLARSAAKPAQALAVLETGGFHQSGFDEEDLALMCASHSSEERHIARSRAMLARIGASEKDLRCGGHSAISESVNRAWIKSDYNPTGISNNCSGKHVGMLAAARALGADLTDYHRPDHPTQQQVKRTVEDVCGLGVDGAKWSIDGCNLPAPAFPLRQMGLMYARFADAADAVDADRPIDFIRTQYMAQIFHAMTRYPEMVGGEDRFCTVLMRTYQGALIGKLGAEGCYGIGIRESEQTRQLGAQGALGISVKIEDGNISILYAVVMEILEQLQIGTPEMWRELEDFHHLKCLNTMGVVTGKILLPFRVRVSS